MARLDRTTVETPRRRSGARRCRSGGHQRIMAWKKPIRSPCRPARFRGRNGRTGCRGCHRLQHSMPGLPSFTDEMARGRRRPRPAFPRATPGVPVLPLPRRRECFACFEARGGSRTAFDSDVSAGSRRRYDRARSGDRNRRRRDRRIAGKPRGTGVLRRSAIACDLRSRPAIDCRCQSRVPSCCRWGWSRPRRRDGAQAGLQMLRFDGVAPTTILHRAWRDYRTRRILLWCRRTRCHFQSHCAVK